MIWMLFISLMRIVFTYYLVQLIRLLWLSRKSYRQTKADLQKTQAVLDQIKRTRGD